MKYLTLSPTNKKSQKKKILVTEMDNLDPNSTQKLVDEVSIAQEHIRRLQHIPSINVEYSNTLRVSRFGQLESG